MSKAKIREEIEQIENITNTWFEFSITGDDHKTILVIETDLDTDPNSYEPKSILNLIEDVQRYLRQYSYTMMIHEVKLVQKTPHFR